MKDQAPDRNIVEMKRPSVVDLVALNRIVEQIELICPAFLLVTAWPSDPEYQGVEDKQLHYEGPSGDALVGMAAWAQQQLLKAQERLNPVEDVEDGAHR